MTLNANIQRGNLHEIPELENPGYSGIYRHNVKTDETTLGKLSLFSGKRGQKCRYIYRFFSE